jgi:hypothetical protein
MKVAGRTLVKMGRAPCCDKDGVKRGPWSPEEDQLLVQYIKQHGHGSWRTLPKHAGICIVLFSFEMTAYFAFGSKSLLFFVQETTSYPISDLSMASLHMQFVRLLI